MKALRPSKKWVLAAIGLLLALLILKIVLFLAAKPKITVDYVAEYNKMARPQDYDPNDNAAPYYQKAFDTFVDMPDELRKPHINWPADFNDTKQALFEKWLISNTLAFEYFREASRKPYYWLARKSDRNNIVAGIMPSELDLLNKLTNALVWNAKFHATGGQSQIAFEYILDCYRAGNHKCHPNLLLMEQLLGLRIKQNTTHNALLILDKTRLDSGDFKFFQDALQAEFDKDTFIPDFQAKKLFLYDALQWLYIDNGKGTGRLAWRAGWYITLLAELDKSELQREYESLKQRLYYCLIGPTRNEIAIQIEQVIALSDKMMTKTPWQIKNENRDYLKEIQNINNSNFFLKILSPNPESTFHSYHQTRAQTEALVAILATLRYKIDTGQFPETLNELVSSGYLQTVPNDPYSNNFLVYKLTEDSFKFYSVGENFKDDNGIVKLDIIYWPVEQQREDKTYIYQQHLSGKISLQRKLKNKLN